VVQLDGQPLTLVGVVPDEVVTFLRERKELFDEAEFEGRLILPLVPAAAGRSRVLLERRRENPVVIVGEAFCREHLGSADPLQAGIRLGVPLFGITGVVKDVRQSGPTRAAWNTVYLLQTRKSRLQTTHVVVKAAGPISDVVRGVVAELSARDIRVCVDEGQRLAALLEGTLAPRTRTLRLLLMSAAVVMLLTAFSVNGALGQFVESQTRQIAVRTALGANRRHTFSLFAGHLGVPCGIGLVLGCFGGWSLARTLSSQLFGVTAADPAAAAGAVAAVLACALIAAGGPFWRARRLDLVSLLQG
jgi:putative ABC transport system permease protein